MLLSDVATIIAADQGVAHKLGGLAITRSPKAGYSFTITPKLIKYRIEREFPGVRGLIKIGGEHVAKVQLQGDILDSQRYISKAAEYLHSKLDDDYLEIQLQPIGIYKDLEVPTGEVKLETHANPIRRANKRMVAWTATTLWWRLA